MAARATRMDKKELEKALRPDVGVTRVGPTLEIKGEVDCSDNLVLEGSLEGDLRCEALVYIGPEGQVVGDITADSVIVEGRVEGNIDAKDRVELKASCKVVGDIRTVRAKVAEGSLLAGNLTVLGDEG